MAKKVILPKGVIDFTFITQTSQLLMPNYNVILDEKKFIFYPFCDQRKQGLQEWQSPDRSNHVHLMAKGHHF